MRNLMLWPPILRHLHLNLTQDLSHIFSTQYRTHLENLHKQQCRIHGMWINRWDVHPMPNIMRSGIKNKLHSTSSLPSTFVHLCDKSFDAPTAQRNKCLSSTSPWNQITFLPNLHSRLLPTPKKISSNLAPVSSWSHPSLLAKARLEDVHSGNLGEVAVS